MERKSLPTRTVMFFIIMIGIIFILAAAWYLWDGTRKQQQDINPELTAWVTDWQWQQGLDDLKVVTESLSSIQMFGVYFDEADQLYLTKQTYEALPHVVDASGYFHSVPVYLTIVNDRIKKDGSTIQKDPALLNRLLATKETRNRHIDGIVELMNTHHVQGIEIDYENVNDKDWEHVSAFYTELYKRLHQMGKKLRIVLESKAKIEGLKFPEGPDYVMMAYNLYGGHSGPGPKADYTFIAKTSKKMEKLPGRHFIALSAGGFDWPETGKAKAITEEQAAELTRRSTKAPQRDAASGCVYFTYLDDSKAKHTVWFADQVTLIQWSEAARKAGTGKIALWRLGGLQQETLNRIDQVWKGTSSRNP